MAEKRAHVYKVTFDHITDIKGEPVEGQSLEFLFKNHDDVFTIMERLKERGLFDSEADIKQFVLGLKFFGDVMMRNKQMELFCDMQPAFIEFMKKLKGKN